MRSGGAGDGVNLWKWALVSLAAPAVVSALAFLFYKAIGDGWFGRHIGAGEVAGTPRPLPVSVSPSASPDAAPDAGAGRSAAKQILFGDLHVHTSYSYDGFYPGMEIYLGEGAKPPADACDYARYCSALDFYANTDHAESVTPQYWRHTIDAVRQCNAVAGDAANPDLVAFLGWEWTQMGRTASRHWGHKNVILGGIEDDEIPTRPIASAQHPWLDRARGPATTGEGFTNWLLGGGDRAAMDFSRFAQEARPVPICKPNVHVKDLPAECMEYAWDPRELFRKLDEWDQEAIVIPHGTTWGTNAGPGLSWDKQLAREQNDPDRQFLFEIYSGHGNSEEFRDYKDVAHDARGGLVCPEPQEDYLPNCWRAGEIIRERCLAEGLDAAACEERAGDARINYLYSWSRGRLTVPGATPEEWRDAGQCRDCFLPPVNHRPKNSAQYANAITNFDDPEEPLRAEFGFVGSSDNHFARPGTGYKEIGRSYNTESVAFTGRAETAGKRKALARFLGRADGSDGTPPAYSIRVSPFQVAGYSDVRMSSFLYTGGLAAVHAAGRDRKSIWSALKRKEVYATSGGRIMLWFDLVNGPGGDRAPMGASVEMGEAPVFEARALGSFKQLPGCPDYAVNALEPRRLDELCRGECYNPSPERKKITRIEVVRIRPQSYPGEPVANLIDDVWLTHHCEAEAEACVMRFSDPDYMAAGRDASYYVRAIEEPSEAINGGMLRCEKYDEGGNCLKLNLCNSNLPEKTPLEDDCLGLVEERAWSSPIFLAFAGAAPVSQAPGEPPAEALSEAAPPQ